MVLPAPSPYHLTIQVKPHHHNRFTALFPGPARRAGAEENFWTLWSKGRLTEADTQTIRLGATPSALTSAHLHHLPIQVKGTGKVFWVVPVLTAHLWFLFMHPTAEIIDIMTTWPKTVFLQLSADAIQPTCLNFNGNFSNKSTLAGPSLVFVLQFFQRRSLGRSGTSFLWEGWKQPWKHWRKHVQYSSLLLNSV